MTRTILHVDMDAFYAAIEERDRPELRGKPIIIGADPQGGRGRGVVSTASYAARKFGVGSAMPISTAWRLCPQGVFIAPDMAKYSRVSDDVMDVLRRFTDQVEQVSVDEAFLDVTRSRQALGDGPTIARAIKDGIRAQTQLTASVGVATSKLLAKIASDLNKPDGLLVVPPGTEREFLAPLPIRRLWGVGPKTEEQLMKLGVQTIGDLARRAALLEQKLGNHGHDLLRLAQGEDDREVLSDSGPARSMGQEHTFDRDTADRDEIRRTLLILADQVAHRLRSAGVRSRTITLKHRDEDFTTVTRAETIAAPTDTGDVLFATVWGLLQPLLRGRKRVRLLGIYASGLAAPPQLALFAAEPSKADLLRDKVQEKFGKGVLTRASLLEGDSTKAVGPKGSRRLRN